MAIISELDALHSFAATGVSRAGGVGTSGMQVKPSTVSGYLEGAVEAVASLPQFAVASLTSGGVSMWNTGVMVANVLGADVEEANTADVLAAFDDDLSKYYLDHKEGADIVGFIATSFIPGGAAVKGLKGAQAGLLAAKSAQAGRFGRLGSIATNVLAPDVATYSYAAKAKIASGIDNFSLLNGAVLKSIGTKAQQAFLESAVFEVAAVAAHANGEVLKDKEAKDVVKDMMLGIGLGTGFGAVFGGISTAFQVKRGVQAMDTTGHALFSLQVTPNITEGTKAYDFIDRLSAVPPPFTVDDVLLGKIPSLTKEFPPVSALENATKVQREAAQGLANRVNELRSKHVNELNNEIRKSITALTPEDGTLAGMVNDVLQAYRPEGASGDFLLNATKLARVGQTGLTKAAKELWDENISWIVMHGDGAGQIMAEGDPRKWRVADLYKAGKIDAAVASNNFAKAKPGVASFRNLEAYSELDADARYLKFERLRREEVDLTKKAYAADDIAALKAAARLGQPILVKAVDGTELMLSGRERILAHLKQEIDSIVTSVAADPKLSAKYDMHSLAHRLDVPVSYIEGGLNGSTYEELMGSVAESAAYTSKMKQAGIYGSGADDVRIRELPKYLGVQASAQNTADFVFADNANMIVDAAATVAARKKVASENALRHTTKAMADHQETWAQLPDIDAQRATRNSGSGLLLSPGTELFGPVAQTQYIGQRVNGMKAKEMERIIEQRAPAFKTVEANPEVAAHFGAIDAAVQRAGEPYVWVTVGNERMLISRSLQKAAMKGMEEAAEEGAEVLTKAMLEDAATKWVPRKAGSKPWIVIPEEATEVFADHMDENARYARQQASIDAARGVDSAELWAMRAEEYYPLPPNPSDFKYYAFVRDTTIGGGANGSTTMIHAATADKLQQMIAKAQAVPGIKVYTGEEATRYYKSMGKFEYEKTLSSARVNTEMERAGVYSDFFVQTDGAKISERLMEYHIGRAHQQIRGAVEARYQDAFETLRKYGEEYTDIATSTKGIRGEKGSIKNPYEDLIKTALDINKFSEYKWHWQTDQLVNDVAATAMSKLDRVRARTPEELAQVQGILDEYGLGKGMEDAAAFLLADHKAGRMPMTKLVQGANRLVATFALRLDALNAVVNTVGAVHMRSSELNFLIRALKDKNVAALGEEFSRIAELDTAGIKQFSSRKLQAEAFDAFAKMRKDHPWYQEFKQKGWITEDVAAQHSIIDELSIQPGDTASKLEARMNSAFNIWHKASEAGAKWTGNNLAESMNRFVTAYTAKRLTELGIKAGVITAKDADVMINAIVNRVDGTLIASQKPILFNGAIGGAVGLFQSYQFRLMQQLFRFVGEGTKKDVAYMLGLQGTLFGANSLPGFHAINEHIVGQASTNPQGRDLYDALYSGAGKHGAELLLYGLPSNLLQNNLYNRGDVSPRHPLILPTSPSEVPAVGMLTKVYGAAKGMIQSGTETGNIGHAILTGLERNGINRPIAGMSMLAKAAVYQDGNVVLRTTKDTDLVTSQLLDLAQVSRLAGGKPMTEAVAVDAYYRHLAFSRRTNEKIAGLSQRIRQELQAGATTQELMDEYLGEFVKTGRKQEDFSKWMMSVIKKATDEKAGVIPSMLSTPHGRTMQIIMGGQDTSRIYAE